MKKKLVAVLLVLTVLAVALTQIVRSIKIDVIECVSSLGECEAELKASLDGLRGIPLISFQSKLTELLGGENKVSSYKFNLKSLGRVEVKVVERVGVVAVQAFGLDGYQLYSKDGVLLETVNETALPLIVLKDTSVTTGKQMEYVIALTEALNKVHSVGRVEIFGSGLNFELPNYPSIIFPLEGDIDVLFGSLTWVLSQLNTGSRDFRMETIDFRFKNPVVKIINNR